MTNDYQKFIQYRNILEEWKISRDARVTKHNIEVTDDGCNISLNDLIKTVTHTKTAPASSVTK